MLTPEEFGARLLQLDPEAISHPAELDELILAVPAGEHGNLLPHIFAFFEALPENDAGAPGPLVHFAETFYPAYKHLLLDSVRRRPSYFGVLMINRILNSELSPVERAEYSEVMTRAADDERTPESIRDFARRLLERQRLIRGSA